MKKKKLIPFYILTTFEFGLFFIKLGGFFHK